MVIALWTLVAVFGYLGCGTLTLWLHKKLCGLWNFASKTEKEDAIILFFYWWIAIWVLGPLYIAKKISALK